MNILWAECFSTFPDPQISGINWLTLSFRLWVLWSEVVKFGNKSRSLLWPNRH